MKILILSLLFSGLVMADDCKTLFEEADSACNSSEVECTTLGACVAKRNTCPGAVKSQQSCEAFNECMSDVDKLNKNRPSSIAGIYFKNACEYHWTTYGQCRLYNTGFEFMTFPTCPGRRIYGKGNDDSNFDCEGHRRLTKKVNTECKELTSEYHKTCKGKIGFKPLRKSYNCEFITAKVFPADTEHKGHKSVDDGERNRQKSVPITDEGSGGEGGNGGSSTDK